MKNRNTSSDNERRAITRKVAYFVAFLIALAASQISTVLLLIMGVYGKYYSQPATLHTTGFFLFSLAPSYIWLWRVIPGKELLRAFAAFSLMSVPIGFLILGITFLVNCGWWRICV